MNPFPKDVSAIPLFPFALRAAGDRCCEDYPRWGVIRFIGENIDAKALLKHQVAEALSWARTNAAHLLQPLADIGFCHILSARPNAVDIQYPPEVAKGLLLEACRGLDLSSIPSTEGWFGSDGKPCPPHEQTPQQAARHQPLQQTGQPLRGQSPDADSRASAQLECESNTSEHSTSSARTPQPQTSPEIQPAHTPGPWRAVKGSEFDSERWQIVFDGPYSWIVATVENGQPGDTLETEGHTAHLIAAAPEMYDLLCRAALIKIDDGWLKEARAVIAKAEGGSL